MAGPLSHIRVLDLSRVLAGPWAGQNLADLGAEVIKVERPGAGDPFRFHTSTSNSPFFLAYNRNKRGLTLDYTQPDGVEVLRLAAKGLTTQQIADRLYISPKTADHHIQHLYTKIGVSTRAAAALWAMQHAVVH